MTVATEPHALPLVRYGHSWDRNDDFPYPQAGRGFEGEWEKHAIEAWISSH